MYVVCICIYIYIYIYIIRCICKSTHAYIYIYIYISGGDWGNMLFPPIPDHLWSAAASPHGHGCHILPFQPIQEILQEKAFPPPFSHPHGCHILPFQPILRNRYFPPEPAKAAKHSPKSISEGVESLPPPMEGAGDRSPESRPYLSYTYSMWLILCISWIICYLFVMCVCLRRGWRCGRKRGVRESKGERVIGIVRCPLIISLYV